MRTLFFLLLASLLFGASNLMISSVYDQNLTLSWTGAGGVSLYRYDSNESNVTHIATLPAGTASHIVTGLQPYTSYTLIVEENDMNETTSETTTHTWSEIMSVCATGKTRAPTKSELEALSSFSCSNSGQINLDAIHDLKNAERIVLRGLILNRPIPSWISELQQLSVLVMSGCRLTGKVPDEIGQLALEILDISANDITGLGSGVWQISSLKELHAAYNRIVQQLDVNVSTMSSLEKLYLQDNQLWGKVDKSFFTLPNLKKLRLNRNNLRIEVPYAAIDMNLSQPSGLGLHGNCRIELPEDANISDDVNDTNETMAWIDAKASLYRGYLGTQQTAGRCWSPAMIPIVTFLLFSPSELVVNGDFQYIDENGTVYDDNSSWTMEAGWTVANAEAANHTVESNIYQNIGTDMNQTYYIRFDTNITSGTTVAYWRDMNDTNYTIADLNATGTFDGNYTTVDSNGYLYLRCSDCSVDNISVKDSQ